MQYQDKKMYDLCDELTPNELYNVIMARMRRDFYNTIGPGYADAWIAVKRANPCPGESVYNNPEDDSMVQRIRHEEAFFFSDASAKKN